MWIRADAAHLDLAGGGQRLRQPHAAHDLAPIPEVQTVVSQHGRPDDGTDATGFFNAEFFVPLKPTRHLAGRHRQGQADRTR